ncbi:UDP-N-acetylmuramoyl-tripeptide--D-alanyl-D-alanine ligase [Patescibacteria group bacterium]
MKSILRKIVLKKLEILARIKLRRMKAKVIGVTGSVGKTSCKDAIYEVLSKRYRVLKNKKSFNSEFGLPLTILQQNSGFNSPIDWVKILFGGFWRTFFVKDKYDYLVLEMGVDKAGDMDFLTKLAPPDFAVITAIKPAHLADGQFKSVDEIFSEKSKIFSNAKTKLINIDDPLIAKIKGDITYGFADFADFKAFSFIQNEKGIDFDVEYKGKDYQFFVPVFGEYHVSTLFPAIVLGFLTDVPIANIQEALMNYRLPPGRLSLIEGLQDTLILDSSYNASPDAVKESLKVLDYFGNKRNGRRVFIFGNMNELGENSIKLHQEIGSIVPQYVDILITVGEDVRYANAAANKQGMNSSNIFSFKSAKEAAIHYKNMMGGRDIILVKGSQNKVRLEIFIKEIMKHPEKAKELLVRQEEKWQNIAP